MFLGHLTQVSPYFEALMDGDFSEGTTINQSVLRRIPLKDVNPEAFALLMEILHFRITKPKERYVTSETLYRMCVLVDMYSLHEPLSIYMDTWIEALEKESPHPSLDDLEYRFFIAHVLEKSKSLKSLVSFATQNRLGAENLADTLLSPHVEGEPRPLSQCELTLKFS